MSDTDDKHCLFFDALGNGPSDVRLIERPIREVVEDGKIIVPRAYGLCWEVTGPLHFVEDGGFMLDAAAVDWLIAKLTAWRDAPRLAARETADVVAQDDDHGFRLLRTTAGEWGVLWQDNEDDEADGEIHWHATERPAREEYAAERGKALCICGAECADDEIDRSGDEPQCPKCVAAAVAAFKVQPMRCCRAPIQQCGWTGTGADLSAPSADFEPYECPKCGAFSVEEIADDQAAKKAG